MASSCSSTHLKWRARNFIAFEWRTWLLNRLRTSGKFHGITARLVPGRAFGWMDRRCWSRIAAMRRSIRWSCSYLSAALGVEVSSFADVTLCGDCPANSAGKRRDGSNRSASCSSPGSLVSPRLCPAARSDRSSTDSGGHPIGLGSLFARGFVTFGRSFAHNAHRHSGYPANNLCLGRVVEHSYLATRMRVGNHHQPASVNLAPAAHIAIAQLREVNRTLEFSFPWRRTDFSLACINLHQGSGTDERVECKVFNADIT